MKNYPSFGSLQLFVNLMSTGNLSRTAAALGIPTSTASRHLAELKDFFGDALFTRCRQGVLPTQRARELLPAVCSLIHDFESLEETRAFNPAEIAREIHIGCVDNAPLAIFPDLMRDLASKAPHLCVNAHPLDGMRYELLRQGELDLLISPMSATPSENFHALNLCEQRYVVVCRRRHPLYLKYLDTGLPIETEDVVEHRFVDVALSHRRSGPMLLRHAVFPEFARAESAVKSYYFLSFVTATFETDFLMVLPETSALYFQNIGLSVILPTKVQSVVHTTKMIWHDTTHNDPVLQWVRAVIFSSASASGASAEAASRSFHEKTLRTERQTLEARRSREAEQASPEAAAKEDN